ncbi:MAG: cytochrome c [Bacteroidales bacterium]|jgi:mono/diheme cytochrome c family protein|nr:cytochrome c [Bacteroidales bacterium]MCK9449057.1 cytochrome c [Bacteroidales bacterium]MDD3702105.1 cytochrome c [Bacteroidales bacterium]MDY0369608.1 cytochrome c [Bacteroidales bacterium]
MNTKTLYSIVLAFAAFTFLAFTFPQDQQKGEPWKIPAEYKTKVNPDKGDAESVKFGKTVYAKHCRSCHGNTGLGDGPKARNLKTHPGDFTDAQWQDSVTDGEIYYMSVIGRDEMPNYEGKIPDEEERWAVINYVRSLKK